MSKHASRKTVSSRPLSRGMWLVSWCLVVFYLAASGRALVPGLCATQRAMEAQCGEESDAPQFRSLRPCCALPRTAPPEERDGPARPVTPGESGCAFCKLVTSVAPAPVHVVLPVPPEPAFGPMLALAIQIPRDGAASTLQSRAPPV